MTSADRFHLPWQPPSITTCKTRYGARVFMRRFAKTAASNVDCSNHPIVFVSATVSCRALLRFYASWTIRLGNVPMTSIECARCR